MSDLWAERKRPVRLERRIEFSEYDQTRDFLDKAADLAESTGYYPDMSFGRTHVSITLHPQGEAEEINDELRDYAKSLDEMEAEVKNAS